MVDTRRLESLISRAGEDTTPARGAAATGQRALALSGHRDMRRAGPNRARSRQQQAMIDANWDALGPCNPDPAPDKLVHQFNVEGRKSPVVARFDLLRAQLVQQFRTHQLISLGITAPLRGTGTTFATTGLLAALTRRGEHRVIGLDMNLRDPALHSYFELQPDHAIADFINGTLPASAFLRRLTGTTALGLSLAEDAYMGGMGLGSQEIARSLHELKQDYAPDMILCDLPNLLHGDTALEICAQLDAVLIVADSRVTRTEDILACERLLTGRTEFLGVILNNYTGNEAL